MNTIITNVVSNDFIKSYNSIAKDLTTYRNPYYANLPFRIPKKFGKIIFDTIKSKDVNKFYELYSTYNTALFRDSFIYKYLERLSYCMYINKPVSSNTSDISSAKKLYEYYSLAKNYYNFDIFERFVIITQYYQNDIQYIYPAKSHKDTSSELFASFFKPLQSECIFLCGRDIYPYIALNPFFVPSQSNNTNYGYHLIGEIMSTKVFCMSSISNLSFMDNCLIAIDEENTIQSIVYVEPQ